MTADLGPAATPRPIPTQEERMRHATTDTSPSFATYLDRTERDQLDARAATAEQRHALQLDALKAAGCTRIFEDTASGKLDERPGLAQALDYIRDGDTLVVWRLDRLGRSVQHLTGTVASLGERGVQFRSLTEGIDTSTAAGKLVFQIFASLAEFERSLIVERTRAGLDAAASRGRRGGRPRALTDEKADAARKLISGGSSVTEAARIVGVSRATLYAHLGEQG